jgi:hypothetical protein
MVKPFQKTFGLLFLPPTGCLPLLLSPSAKLAGRFLGLLKEKSGSIPWVMELLAT